MNYIETYDRLVQKRLNQPAIGQYIECHHIVPKSEGGSNDKSNLVKLTAREHFIAHLLLAKIYDDVKMHYALNMMTIKSMNHQRTFKITSRQYDYIKRLMAKKQSEHYKTKENHPMFGRHHTDESKRKNSESHKGSKNPRYGKLVSIETRQKISNALKGRKKTSTMSEDARKRLSEQRKGKRLSDLAYQHAKQKLSKHVGQYDDNGDLLKVYDSVSSTAKAIGVSIFAISKCCRGKMKRCRGFVFKFMENPDE